MSPSSREGGPHPVVPLGGGPSSPASPPQKGDEELGTQRQASFRSSRGTAAFESAAAAMAGSFSLPLGPEAGVCRTPLLASLSSPLESETGPCSQPNARDVWPSLCFAHSSAARHATERLVGDAPRSRTECVPPSLLFHHSTASFAHRASPSLCPPGHDASFRPTTDVLPPSPRGPFFLVDDDSPSKFVSCSAGCCLQHSPRRLREAPEESLHFAASFDCASDAGNHGLDADDQSTPRGLCRASAFGLSLPFSSSATRRLPHPPDRLGSESRNSYSRGATHPLLPSSQPYSGDTLEDEARRVCRGCCRSARKRDGRHDFEFSAQRHAGCGLEGRERSLETRDCRDQGRYSREGNRQNVQAFLGSGGTYNVLHKWRYTHGYLDFILNDRFHVILSMKWAHLVFLVFAVVVGWAAFLALILAVLTGGEIQRCLGPDAANVLDYYFFVIETMFAIGYGSPRAPTCQTTSLFVTPTAVSGILINSVVLGVVFQKFSAASKRKWALAFSNCLVGQPSFPVPSHLVINSSVSLEKGPHLPPREMVYGCCASVHDGGNPGLEAEQDCENGDPGLRCRQESASTGDVCGETAERTQSSEGEGPSTTRDAQEMLELNRRIDVAIESSQSEADGNEAAPASHRRTRRSRTDEQKSDGSDASPGSASPCCRTGATSEQDGEAHRDTRQETFAAVGVFACRGGHRDLTATGLSQTDSCSYDVNGEREEAEGFGFDASEDRQPCSRAREETSLKSALTAPSISGHLSSFGPQDLPHSLCRAPSSSTWQHYRLSFRVINVTHHSFFNPKLCLYLLKHSDRGLRIRQFPTFRTDTPLEFLEMPITVTVDTCDRDCPLREVTADELRHDGNAYEILSLLSFTDNHTSRPVEIRKSWSLRSIKWGEKFIPIVRPPSALTVSAGGYEVDVDALSTTERAQLC
ncbi:hypothetical protein TGGT1_284530 [Toxoplasma gondii GT1]|uniref:Inward rectifier potassium channel protein n=5 Tax=Toxoplasma gondii TaxID=5811 RepID=S7UNN7_TOXGG|nr:hypothetical protein TGGT1_284530 [Toxoplasma gondii GT1]KAF4643931.1 hypothetical protein TGRH88_026870 [Toxoplasma gondii]KFG54658.1 inward rectifier potassium channel protein [Toxoplasma gondii FOU]PUA87932.1 inward rectifier potassium channel protein [Toxoplasma gondii TgCATBr9]RQX67111.1 inward rectifier potassium channel protein [Toxoplasma gondii CAST]